MSRNDVETRQVNGLTHHTHPMGKNVSYPFAADQGSPFFFTASWTFRPVKSIASVYPAMYDSASALGMSRPVLPITTPSSTVRQRQRPPPQPRAQVSACCSPSWWQCTPLGISTGPSPGWMNDDGGLRKKNGSGVSCCYERARRAYAPFGQLRARGQERDCHDVPVGTALPSSFAWSA